MTDLKGRTALVAGASRGIGLAIARELARSGAKTILASRNIDLLESEAAKLRDEGFEATAHALDMKDPNTFEDLPDLDILMNVAGVNKRKAFIDYTPDEYQHILQTNLHGMVTLTQVTGRRLIERGQGGKVVFIGSLMSLLGLPWLSVYAITKSALAGLTRTLAAEWGRYNIQVNCIAPGFILTDLNRDMWEGNEILRNWLSNAQANPNMGTPEDIAPLAAFLSGPGSHYITGQVIAVDGGYSTTASWPFEPGR